MPAFTGFRPGIAVLVLKAVHQDQYRPPIPKHPLAMANPDGVWYDRVAHLPSFAAPDVAEWVARWHAEPGVRVLVAFTSGTVAGQCEPAADAVYTIEVRTGDVGKVRRTARDDLREHLRTVPYARYDHLITDPVERAIARNALLRAAGVNTDPLAPIVLDQERYERAYRALA